MAERHGSTLKTIMRKLIEEINAVGPHDMKNIAAEASNTPHDQVLDHRSSIAT